MLLQSLKPSLHTNVDCSALVAAVVSRQVSVVQLLLQVTFCNLPHLSFIILVGEDSCFWWLEPSDGVGPLFEMKKCNNSDTAEFCILLWQF